MASMTMTSTFLGSSATQISKQVVPTANRRRPSAICRASMKVVVEGEKIEMNNNNNKNNEEEGAKGRRDLVFGGGSAAAAVVAFGISKIAMADEPPRGSPEAKKKYAPVCVTMPTARICRK